LGVIKYAVEVLMYLSDIVVEDFGLVMQGTYFTIDGQNIYKILYATAKGYYVREVLEHEIQGDY